MQNCFGSEGPWLNASRALCGCSSRILQQDARAARPNYEPSWRGRALRLSRLCKKWTKDMTYILFSLPHVPRDLDFRLLTTAQSRENFESFVAGISERVNYLSGLVRIEHPDWQPDLSGVSLAVLGEWYARHMEERSATEEESNQIKENLGPLASVADVCPQFTPMTLSIGADIGIYVGECIRMRCPATAWRLHRRMKQPVVAGAGIVKGEEYPPIAQAQNLAIEVSKQRVQHAMGDRDISVPTTLGEAHVAALLSAEKTCPSTMLHRLMMRSIVSTTLSR